MEAYSISPITKQFGVGLCLNVSPIHGGKVNSTFRVETENGTFILQKLKPPLNEKTALDGWSLSTHLRLKDFPAPVFLLTNQGLPYIKELSGTYRLMTFLEGHTVEAIDTPRKAYSTGRLVGRFHRALSDFDYQPLASLDEIHNPGYILSRLENLFLNNPVKALEAEHIWLKLQSEIPLQLLPPDLPSRPIHGDLKYTNILFDNHAQPFAIVDFDTLMISTLPVEMGDAFRSWCTRKNTPQGPFFDQTIFESAWKGYLSAEPPASRQEMGYILQGIKLLLLELSARYLIDYFEDYYFAWDTERFRDRSAHNLFRAGRQLALFTDLEEKEEELRRILEEIS
jgi:Ser/Thr protein kinase RdoA (MazF antagonist)